MHITTFTTGFTFTYNLHDYQNVKPSITLTVQVNDGDDLAALMASTADSCRAYVYDEIDKTLEQLGQSPRFTAEPLYYTIYWEQYHAWFILPAYIDYRTLPGSWYNRTDKMRLDAVRAIVHKDAPTVDKSDGVLSPLLSWWNERKFYHVWTLPAWNSRYNSHAGAYLLVRDGLAPLREYANHLAPDHSQQISELAYLSLDIPRLIADDQSTLDAIVADWWRTHPRPGDVPEDEYQPGEYDADVPIAEEPEPDDEDEPDAEDELDDADEYRNLG